MSLDFYLTLPEQESGEPCEHCRGTGKKTVRPEAHFSSEITHNLGPMANAAGVYECLWEPSEYGFRLARDIIPFLRVAIMKMERDPESFKRINPPNGWGSYDALLSKLRDIQKACAVNPYAEIRASR